MASEKLYQTPSQRYMFSTITVSCSWYFLHASKRCAPQMIILVEALLATARLTILDRFVFLNPIHARINVYFLRYCQVSVNEVIPRIFSERQSNLSRSYYWLVKLCILTWTMRSETSSYQSNNNVQTCMKQSQGPILNYYDKHSLSHSQFCNV